MPTDGLHKNTDTQRFSKKKGRAGAQELDKTLGELYENDAMQDVRMDEIVSKGLKGDPINRFKFLTNDENGNIKYDKVTDDYIDHISAEKITTGRLDENVIPELDSGKINYFDLNRPLQGSLLRPDYIQAGILPCVIGKEVRDENNTQSAKPIVPDSEGQILQTVLDENNNVSIKWNKISVELIPGMPGFTEQKIGLVYFHKSPEVTSIDIQINTPNTIICGNLYCAFYKLVRRPTTVMNEPVDIVILQGKRNNTIKENYYQLRMHLEKDPIDDESSHSTQAPIFLKVENEVDKINFHLRTRETLDNCVHLKGLGWLYKITW